MVPAIGDGLSFGDRTTADTAGPTIESPCPALYCRRMRQWLIGSSLAIMLAVGLTSCTTESRADPSKTPSPPSTETFVSTPGSSTTTTPPPSPCDGLGIHTNGSPESTTIEQFLLPNSDIPGGWTTTGPTIAAAPGPPSTAILPSTNQNPVASITYEYPPPAPPSSGPAPTVNSVSETLARFPTEQLATEVLGRLNAQASQCNQGPVIALPDTTPSLSATLGDYGSSYQDAATATVFVQRGSFVAELYWSDIWNLRETGGRPGTPPIPTPAQMTSTVTDALASLPSQ